MYEISLEDKIKIMDHYRQGENVEFKFKTVIWIWFSIKCPSWNWGKYDYRIKY